MKMGPITTDIVIRWSTILCRSLLIELNHMLEVVLHAKDLSSKMNVGNTIAGKYQLYYETANGGGICI